MTKRRTHTLELHSKHTYPLTEVEGKRLPELDVELDYLGWYEDRSHQFEGRVKILYAGDLFLAHLPARLKKLKSEQFDVREPNKRRAEKAAMDWADELIGEFLATGLFGLAVLDASGMERGIFEYEPELKVVEAKVYRVN